MQEVIVIVLVTIAAIYIFSRLKGSVSDSGNSGCDKCK